jgi:putative ATP-binding cassette transporter
MLVSHVAIDATVGLRKKLYLRISQLPIRDLEQIGPSRLLTALNNDIQTVTAGAAAFPKLLVSFVTLLGMLSFLMYLNIAVFIFVVGIIIFGAVTYKIPVIFGHHFVSKARDSFDGIQEGLRGLIYGAKELKLNEQKLHDYLAENLTYSEDSFSVAQKRGKTLLSFGLNYGSMICFFAIGVVAYIMGNYYTLSQQNLLGTVMVLLYITGPLSIIITSMSPIILASVAAKKLDKLLSEMPVESLGEGSEVFDCQDVKVKGIEYTYTLSKGEGFHLGPVDLTLRRGEVTFLVGSNGSGKTTLGKLLSLHYVPDKGHIYFDDKMVTDDNRKYCRENISAIYSDFYLFTKLYGLSSEEIDLRAMQNVKDLGLEGKVTIQNGEFSSTDLSAGQKKRLALLVACLEDRAIYVFDEWAADQDPGFKEIFYYQILPSLKKLNKLVIVITHDDRYFHLADKLVKMESGKRLLEEGEHNKEGKKEIETMTEKGVEHAS